MKKTEMKMRQPDVEIGSVRFWNADNMEFMRGVPDGYYELAIVDPPYGIGEADGRCRTRKKHNNKVRHKAKEWDKLRPTSEYWEQLKRVSKNQIVWGGNYFVQYLEPKMGWIYWDKKIGGDFSDGELAYTSFDRALKSFSFWNGNNGIAKIHPTQKPAELYRWIIKNYAKSGDKILDSHLGSGSIAIACDTEGFSLDCCEIDKEYFDSAVSRFRTYHTNKTEIATIGYARTALNLINPTLF